DDDWREGGEDERRGEFVEGFSHGHDARFAGVAVDDDAFDDDDGVVDDETDGGGETAERHQVEAFSDHPEEENCDRYGDRNDQTRDERGGPVAQEEKEDDAGEEEADEDGVANAGDALADELGLVVEGFEVDAGGKYRLERIDL